MRSPSRYRGRTSSRLSPSLILSVIAGMLMLIALLVLLVFRPWAQEPAADSPPPETAQPSPTGDQPSPSVDPDPENTAVSGVESPSPRLRRRRSRRAAMTSPSRVPESEAAQDSYFEDAVFVGDSRTAGFMLYSGVPPGTA